MDVQLNRGYHNTDIPKGEFGKLSKITEEYLELVDANAQGVRILELNELADLIGAVEGYAETLGFTLSDLIAMKDRTAAAFASGERKSAPVPAMPAAPRPYTTSPTIGPVFDNLFVVATVHLVHVVDPILTRIYVNTDEIDRDQCWDIAKDLEQLEHGVDWHYNTLLAALRKLATGSVMWLRWSECQLWSAELKASNVTKSALRITLDTNEPPAHVAKIERLLLASIERVSAPERELGDEGEVLADEDVLELVGTLYVNGAETPVFVSLLDFDNQDISRIKIDCSGLAAYLIQIPLIGIKGIRNVLLDIRGSLQWDKWSSVKLVETHRGSVLAYEITKRERIRSQTCFVNADRAPTATTAQAVADSTKLFQVGSVETDSLHQKTVSVYVRIDDTGEQEREAIVQDLNVLRSALLVSSSSSSVVSLDTLHSRLVAIVNSNWGAANWRACSLWLVTLVPYQGATALAVLVHTKPGYPASTASERVVRKLLGVPAQEPEPVPVLQAPDDAAVQGYTIQCIGDIDGISICCATSLGHFSNVETLVLSTTLKSPRVAEHKLRIVSELKSFTGNVSEQARARYYASELQIALHQTEQDRIWRNVCFLASAQEQGCAVLVLPRDKRNGALGWKHCTSGSVSIMVPADAVARELLHSEELAERERED